jgi:Na+/H+-dicarboxylate symporter
MVLGGILGIIIHNTISEEAALGFSNKIKNTATVFIRLVQMIISPLVLQH